MRYFESFSDQIIVPTTSRREGKDLYHRVLFSPDFDNFKVKLIEDLVWYYIKTFSAVIWIPLFVDESSLLNVDNKWSEFFRFPDKNLKAQNSTCLQFFRFFNN